MFDTVDKAVSRTFFENLAHALGGRKLDYLVISHMEPDHAATIEELTLRHPEVTIVCNAKIKTMLGQFFTLSDTLKYHIVAEGDKLSTGKHEFTFVMAPMVHWPEVMMTYDLTDKMLFSADAFGTFGALNGHLFNDEVDFFADYVDEARRYYTNIVGKYGAQVQAVLKKAAGLELNYVCPLHGFVWRSHFGDFLEKYLKWSSYTPEENGVMIAYASVYGHTENTVNILACKLVERGLKVKVYDTSVTPASYIVSDAFRYSHLVFASTTYNAGIFVTMENLVHDIVNHNLQGRKIAVLENGSWAATSGKLMKDQPAEPIGQALEVDNGAFNKFSYGVEILTTNVDGKDYGCVINTAGQVAAGDPKKITISVIKKNNTCDMVAKAGKFNISILTEDAPYSLFQHFGFQSGRDVDKFADFSDLDRMTNGIAYVTKYTNAVLSCEIIDVVDVETQVLYVANVVEAKVLSAAPSCTYGYYHAHIKPKKNPAPAQGEGYVCKVCGYFHEGSEMPDDFVCPLCKHGKEDFEHIVPEVKQPVKGYVCTVCDHFVECDGERLAEQISRMKEAFEPAVR